MPEASLPGRGIEDVCVISDSGSGDNPEPPRLPALLAAATARSNKPLLPLLLAFEVVLLLLIEPAVDRPLAFEFEIVLDSDAATADFIEEDLSVRFRNGLGRLSSSAKSYSGDGWDRGTGIESVGGRVEAETAELRLLLLVAGRR